MRALGCAAVLHFWVGDSLWLLEYASTPSEAVPWVLSFVLLTAHYHQDGHDDDALLAQVSACRTVFAHVSSKAVACARLVAQQSCTFGLEIPFGCWSMPPPHRKQSHGS
mmetsp:Transcript_135805/g.307229  ORF Transcript_135805/g.307229 Transcript_135805/m.307229 type:complete len:109 (-) Transcript_135805:20-346(-)